MSELIASPHAVEKCLSNVITIISRPTKATNLRPSRLGRIKRFVVRSSVRPSVSLSFGRFVRLSGNLLFYLSNSIITDPVAQRRWLFHHYRNDDKAATRPIRRLHLAMSCTIAIASAKRIFSSHTAP